MIIIITRIRLELVMKWNEIFTKRKFRTFLVPLWITKSHLSPFKRVMCCILFESSLWMLLFSKPADKTTFSEWNESMLFVLGQENDQNKLLTMKRKSCVGLLFILLESDGMDKPKWWVWPLSSTNPSSSVFVLGLNQML